MERKITREFADVVCIFTSPDRPGIMFYDRTPEPGSPVAKFTGGVEEGKYITDRTSISVAEWDEEMHVENGDRIVRYINGSVKVTTIIVPEEKMMEIIDGITKSEDPGRIVIDTGNVKTRLYDEQMSTNRNTEISTANYESFKQLRDEVMQSIHQHDRFDISDVPSFNNTDTSGKGLK